MKRMCALLCLCLFAGFSSVAAPPGFKDPFSAAASLTNGTNNESLLTVKFTIPPGHHLYADSMKVTPGPGIELAAKDIPTPTKIREPGNDDDTLEYGDNVSFVYTVRNTNALRALDLSIEYRGCSETMCFPPTTRKLRIEPAGPGESHAPAATPEEPAVKSATSYPKDAWQEHIKPFTIAGKAFGYLDANTFITFIDNAEQGKGMEKDRLQVIYDKNGFWLLILLILLGGLSLNLTPCVLPMIPINIAIIGAGTGGGSRLRGFMLGGSYGLGIAAVYGLLGLAVVLTGARFGAINSSPWFNFVIAAVFIIMALGMFGVIPVDLSRFQGSVDTGTGNKRGKFTGAFILGGVAALLAGACVAPVVISVLLLSADLHARGNPAGLALPFLLGLGMALPWPFAGAGLSFLPKPGKWMERVKYGFGIFILLFALYYGYLGYTLLANRLGLNNEKPVTGHEQSVSTGWLVSLDDALVLAAKEKKPVLVDFWASWCKNCLQMEHTTFTDPAVQARLKDYIKVKFRAEDMSSAEAKPVLDYLGINGLPAYVIFLPADDRKPR